MFSSSDSMRQVASVEDMPWFHDPTPTLKPLHCLAPWLKETSALASLEDVKSSRGLLGIELS